MSDVAHFTPPIEFLLVDHDDYSGPRVEHLGRYEPTEAFKVRAQLVDGQLRVQVHAVDGCQHEPSGPALMAACMHAARRFAGAAGLALGEDGFTSISAVIVPTKDTPAAGLAPTLATS